MSASWEIPRYPRYGAELEPWMRGYTFLEGQKYRQKYEKVNAFLTAHRDSRLLFLELGGRLAQPAHQGAADGTGRLETPRLLHHHPFGRNLPKIIRSKSCGLDGPLDRVLAHLRTACIGRNRAMKRRLFHLPSRSYRRLSAVA